MELRDKKLFLLDMDGTIYLQDKLFDGVLNFLEGIKQRKGRYIFFSNNSSMNVNKYIEKLGEMKIHSTREDFLTSTDATIVLLKDNAWLTYRKGYSGFLRCPASKGEGKYCNSLLRNNTARFVLCEENGIHKRKSY